VEDAKVVDIGKEQEEKKIVMFVMDLGRLGMGLKTQDSRHKTQDL
jgi:hypothetical protein